MATAAPTSRTLSTSHLDSTQRIQKLAVVEQRLFALIDEHAGRISFRLAVELYPWADLKVALIELGIGSFKSAVTRYLPSILIVAAKGTEGSNTSNTNDQVESWDLVRKNRLNFTTNGKGTSTATSNQKHAAKAPSSPKNGCAVSLGAAATNNVNSTSGGHNAETSQKRGAFAFITNVDTSAAATAVAAGARACSTLFTFKKGDDTKEAELRPNASHSKSLVESDDSSTLLALLSDDLADELKDATNQLTDIVLDLGRQPFAWVAGERQLLGDKNRVVSSTEITSIVGSLSGPFGKDNRAGLEGQLHRISAVLNNQDDIIGLTLRVGRHVSGNAAMIADLLFESSAKSILFLGAPGSGKTTVIREVTRLLAEKSNVCIVDTSNEIAGAGNIPHPCVGFARRMMVPRLDQQSDVMIECVQNHTPSVMVIDEIGRPKEVYAAQTCKQRKVRLIASAHGDLRSLVQNKALRGLIGGVQNVTLGDSQAKLEARRQNAPGISKTKTERGERPTFDVIVELSRGEYHSWRVIRDAAEAVDCILNGQSYRIERRSRDPKTGEIQITAEDA